MKKNYSGRESKIYDDYKSFSTQELEEKLKSGKYMNSVNLIIQDILNERGIDSGTKQFSAENAEEIKESDNNAVFLIVVAYIFALLGGILGILFGFQLLSKMKLADGSYQYRYNKTSRNHGKVALTIAIISFVIGILIRLQ
jgi:hypothetical protein